jgi:hypothetical protein
LKSAFARLRSESRFNGDSDDNLDGRYTQVPLRRMGDPGSLRDWAISMGCPRSSLPSSEDFQALLRGPYAPLLTFLHQRARSTEYASAQAALH